MLKCAQDHGSWSRDVSAAQGARFVGGIRRWQSRSRSTRDLESVVGSIVQVEGDVGGRLTPPSERSEAYRVRGRSLCLSS
jgi:hypothetical protein